MKKYDGWVIKTFRPRNPYIIIGYFQETRKEVIKRFEDLFGEGEWQKERRKGYLKLVKVKMIEVE